MCLLDNMPRVVHWRCPMLPPQVYGFMLLVFLILIIVTICVTIVCTYFLLNAEDYRWQWTRCGNFDIIWGHFSRILTARCRPARRCCALLIVCVRAHLRTGACDPRLIRRCGQCVNVFVFSFLAAGSTSIYVYLYSIYYYLFKTKMSGMFQTSFYFSYMALMSLVLGIMYNDFDIILPALLRSPPRPPLPPCRTSCRTAWPMLRCSIFRADRCTFAAVIVHKWVSRCGTLGFAGSNIFVRKIYRNIKID